MNYTVERTSNGVLLRNVTQCRMLLWEKKKLIFRLPQRVSWTSLILHRRMSLLIIYVTNIFKGLPKIRRKLLPEYKLWELCVCSTVVFLLKSSTLWCREHLDINPSYNAPLLSFGNTMQKRVKCCHQANCINQSWQQGSWRDGSTMAFI